MADSQRRRLLAALIEVVSERGYLKTTVADVIARAGVSRRAFYEHFPNREQCFLEAYDTVIATVAGEAADAYRSAGDAQRGAEAAIGALFERAIESPQVVPLVLVEIGAVRPGGFARRERLIGAYERQLGEALGLTVDPAGAPNPLLRAIVGGLNEVLFARVRSHRERELRTLAPELVRWLHCYHPAPQAVLSVGDPLLARASSVGSSGGRAPGSLSLVQVSGRRRGLRGEQNGSHSFVVHNQRERILDAVANLSAAKGYAAVTVRDIADGAAVSLDAFYGNFAGKEDAFLVAYEVGHGKSLAVVERAFASEADWRLGVRAGIAALCDFLASEPTFAHISLVDARIASRRSAELARKGVKAYSHMVLAGLQEAPTGGVPPEVRVEAVIGGLFELCLTYTLRKRAAALAGLVCSATYFALAPFIGAQEAARVATEAD